MASGSGGKQLSKQMSEKGMGFDWSRGPGNLSGKSGMPKNLRFIKFVPKDAKETPGTVGAPNSGSVPQSPSNSGRHPRDAAALQPSCSPSSSKQGGSTSSRRLTFQDSPKKVELSNMPSDDSLLERLGKEASKNTEKLKSESMSSSCNPKPIPPVDHKVDRQPSHPTPANLCDGSEANVDQMDVKKGSSTITISHRKDDRELSHFPTQNSIDEFDEKMSQTNNLKDKSTFYLSKLILALFLGILLLETYMLSNSLNLLSEMRYRMHNLEEKLGSINIPQAFSQMGNVDHRPPESITRENSIPKPRILESMSLDPKNSTDRFRKLSFTLSIACIITLTLLSVYMDSLHHLFCRLAGIKIADNDVFFSKRMAYRVDVLLSSSPWMKPLGLLVTTLVLIVFGGFLFYGVDGRVDPEESLSLLESMWISWTFTADPGNHANITGFFPRTVSLLISLGGFLIFAVFVGLTNEAISERVDSLRKGKSEVVERNHTLILGWSHKLGFILKEIAIANECTNGGVMVVLSERSKEDMEADLSRLELNLRGSSVICRSGSPLLLADLRKVSIATAQSIIVLAEVDNADQSDARALRIVQSIMGLKDVIRKDAHIVVEVSDVENQNLIKTVGKIKERIGDKVVEKSMVETVVAYDMIGRLMIQCARLPGLAEIWENLLGFDKCEFYRKKWPQVAGKPFGEVLLSFPEAIPFGVQMSRDGRIFLNPPDDYVLQPNDEVLVVAENHNTYRPALPPRIRASALPDENPFPRQEEHILFCGWRRDMDEMINVLDTSLAQGSEIWIFSEIPIEERVTQLRDGSILEEELNNVRISHRLGNPVIRRNLEGLPLNVFDSIIILADANPEENTSGMDADSKTLATLLLIRDIQSKRAPEGQRSELSFSRCVIVSEILDSRTRSLVSKLNISDYVLSNELVSKALAMVSKDREVNRILEELFQVDGNELFIKSARYYIHYDQEELSFYDIMLRARKRMEIVIGFWLPNDKPLINPPNKSLVMAWTMDTKFVIFALEE